MKNRVKDWILAFAFGVIVPALIFAVGELLISEKKPQSEISQSDDAELHVKEPTKQHSPEIENPVSVVMDDGTVLIMDMDVYLTGVVLAEMPANFETEALKAQAVVARTYALKCAVLGSKHKSGDVCTRASCCQAYRPVSAYLAEGGKKAAVDKVERAVLATSGQILTYQGELIEATYFSCSGGRTEDAAAVWGMDVPYLQSVESPGEENAAYYTETISLAAADVALRLGLSPTGIPASWFGTVTRTAGGGVGAMDICGVCFRGTELRQKLGLRSTAFTMVAIGETIYISTKGYGHRVGMSQYGADAMAVNGNTYRQILSHYYPGTVLEVYLQN